MLPLDWRTVETFEQEIRIRNGIEEEGMDWDDAMEAGQTAALWNTAIRG